MQILDFSVEPTFAIAIAVESLIELRYGSELWSWNSGQGMEKDSIAGQAYSVYSKEEQSPQQERCWTCHRKKHLEIEEHGLRASTTDEMVM